ncbi:hypothetical protein THOG11_30124 [Vibrio harveyi]|nr:hypothetical protein TH15OA1_400009 [Vibrio harveyi]CAH1542981.1 hypothetical protein VHARVF571_530112 [Vibrio harveyi]CAH1571027.1 hypothetical protein THOG11_30124 [Vibrio harveyi]CAH1584526.1 hypothetical protein THOD03_90003 [Vibrio harveyi]CAK6715900.1 hypothetical protein HORM4_730018 [Vibrio harveyi]
MSPLSFQISKIHSSYITDSYQLKVSAIDLSLWISTTIHKSVT